MKIEELLYKLHHWATIPFSEQEEIKKMVMEYPQLLSLDQDGWLQNTNYSDLGHKIGSTSKAVYSHSLDDEYTYKPELEVFNIPNSVPESSFTSGHEVAESPMSESEDKSLPFQGPENKHRTELYTFEDSDFLTFLKKLPPVSLPRVSPTPINSESVHVDESNSSSQQTTDQLIRKSTELYEGVTSESLANLWALQGKHELAIMMFEKLAVANPEKSATFAAKIEKLKAENPI